MIPMQTQSVADNGESYDIQVNIFEDSLRISMPMDFLMIPAHPSRPRNKLIAQAFLTWASLSDTAAVSSA